MSIPYVIPGLPRDAEEADLRAMERLVSDLRRYADGFPPTDAELAAAPLIERWAALPDPAAFRLTGRILGHPRLGACVGVTSRVHAFGRDGRWVRSYSRLWRLGDQAVVDHRDVN